MKLIKLVEYNRMKRELEEKIKFEQLYNAQVRDNNHLRDQINSDIKKIRTAEEERNNINFCEYYVLHESNYPCDHCSTETKECKKIIFADRTICICPKDEVKTFCNKNKEKKPNHKI